MYFISETQMCLVNVDRIYIYIYNGLVVNDKRQTVGVLKGCAGVYDKFPGHTL